MWFIRQIQFKLNHWIFKVHDETCVESWLQQQFEQFTDWTVYPISVSLISLHNSKQFEQLRTIWTVKTVVLLIKFQIVSLSCFDQFRMNSMNSCFVYQISSSCLHFSNDCDELIEFKLPDDTKSHFKYEIYFSIT